LRPFPFLLGAGLLFESAGYEIFVFVTVLIWILHLLILVDISKRFVLRPISWSQLHLLLFREILSMALYFASYGHQILWRGRRFSVLKGGRLRELNQAAHSQNQGHSLK
jgi:hypothetical protein